MKRTALASPAIAAFLCLVSSAPVWADTILVAGAANGSLATATVSSTFNAQTNTFTTTIVNTSPFDALITGIGYDLPPVGSSSTGSGLNGFTGNVIFQPAGVGFTFSDGLLGPVPLFPTAVLDFGFLTGANFEDGNLSLGLPPGIDPGDEITFVVSGAAFAGLTEAQITESVYLRFEGVGPTGTHEDVASLNAAAAPEPSTLALLALGAAAAIRTRRRQP